MNSKSYRILLLLVTGPKSRGDIAEDLGIEKIVYNRNFEEEKRLYNLDRKNRIPPRRNTTVYPSLSGFLNYLSRGLERNKRNYKFKEGTWGGNGKLVYDLNDKDSRNRFIELYKPLILPTKYKKWEITKWGRNAIRQLDGN